MTHAVLVKPDGHDIVYAFDPQFMEGFRQKTQLSLILLKEILEHNAPLAFVADCFRGIPPNGKTLADMPGKLKDWPKEYLQDFMMCCCNKIGMQGVMIIQPYVRNGNEITWHTPEVMDEDSMVGDNSYMFDLTGDIEKIKLKLEEVLDIADLRDYKKIRIPPNASNSLPN